MCVLKLTLGKIIFLQIFLNCIFFFSVKLPDSLLLSPDGYDSDGQVTCPDARSSAICLCGSPHPDGLLMHPDGYPTGLSIAFLPSCRIAHFFFSIFLGILVHLTCFFFSRVLSLFCPLVHFFFILDILLHLLHYFQF
jgi:hypothetical protein